MSASSTKARVQARQLVGYAFQIFRSLALPCSKNRRVRSGPEAAKTKEGRNSPSGLTFKLRKSRSGARENGCSHQSSSLARGKYASGSREAASARRGAYSPARGPVPGPGAWRLAAASMSGGRRRSQDVPRGSAAEGRPSRYPWVGGSSAAGGPVSQGPGRPTLPACRAGAALLPVTHACGPGLEVRSRRPFFLARLPLLSFSVRTRPPNFIFVSVCFSPAARKSKPRRVYGCWRGP